MVQKIETKYGLRQKGKKKLLGFYTTSNSEGDFCVAIEYTLCYQTDNVWLVNSKKTAEFAKNPTAWYNADYTSPNHNFKPEELEVVEVKLTYIT